MDLADIKRRADELEHQLKALSADDEDFDDEITAIPAMDLSTYLAFLSERAKTPYGAALSRLREFLSELFDAFVDGVPSNWRELADVFDSRISLLVGMTALMDERGWLLEKSVRSEKAEHLRHLLAVAVLMGEWSFQSDVGLLLSSAWESAERGDLDASEYFAWAAERASDQVAADGLSVARYLREFEPLDLSSWPVDSGH